MISLELLDCNWIVIIRCLQGVTVFRMCDNEIIR